MAEPEEKTEESVYSVSEDQSEETLSEEPEERPVEAVPDDSENASKEAISELPVYDGIAHITVNDGEPFFAEEDLLSEPFEHYSELDTRGRCGAAYACLSLELMPTEERGVIGDIRPSGWHTQKYDIIPDPYLYNRCHLIGYQLTGQNDNERNLITGTRYFKIDGMLPVENEVADYIRSSSDHVLYRVTPYFKDDDLLCSGVLIEARSVSSSDLRICEYCYNVQPGIEIDYSDGSSRQIEEVPDNEMAGTVIPEGTTYVLNTNSLKFHKPECDSVGDMKPKNTEFFSGTREEAMKMGYDPCGRCNP
ncbi:MAG: DNA/RNA non-specific endonuclease [Lachnospiraceae bacterium]|nr:DNA/RNA non-specific endonuclease [Lachnospiraceae bacterium]